MTREALARVVGENVAIEALIDDIREELRARPYEIVFVAGGWRFQSRAKFAPFIRAAAGAPASAPLSETQARVVTAIAYFQPLTRAELCQILGREISRDLLAALRETGLDRRRAAQPARGRARHLRHDGEVPGTVRFRLAARPARHGKARGRRAAEQGSPAIRRTGPAFGIEIDEPEEQINDEDVAFEAPVADIEN